MDGLDAKEQGRETDGFGQLHLEVDGIGHISGVCNRSLQSTKRIKLWLPAGWLVVISCLDVARNGARRNSARMVGECRTVIDVVEL